MFFYFKDILQHFKFVNWRIRFLMSRTGNNLFRAPSDCFQFYTGIAGRVKSFNYGGTNLQIWDSTNGLSYSACIRQELGGYCFQISTFQEIGKILNQIWLLNFRLLWNLMGTNARINYRYIWFSNWYYCINSKFIYVWIMSRDSRWILSLIMSFGQTVEY